MESGLDPGMFLVQIWKFQLLFKHIRLDWIGLERRPKADRRTEGNPVSVYLTRSYTMAIRQPCIFSVSVLATSMSGSGRQLRIGLAKDSLKNVGDEMREAPSFRKDSESE